MHQFFVHNFSSYITALALTVFLCAVFANTVSSLFLDGDFGHAQTELPEPEDNNSEKDEKKLEEDLDDKISNDIIKICVPPALYPKSGLFKIMYFPTYLPEIYTPPPERVSFS